MIAYDDVFPPGTIRPRGLFHVFGRPGVGKSTFCITVGMSPDRIAVFDFESSLAPANELLNFAVYHNMMAEWTDKRGLTAPPRDLYAFIMKLVGELPPVDLIVVDNIEPLELAIEDMVESNPSAFGISAGQMEKMQGLKWGAVKRLYASFIQYMLGKAPLVGFTSHLRQVWAGRAPVPGLFQPRGKSDVMEAQTFLRIWLNLRSEGPEPSGLVLKSRLATYRTNPDGTIMPQPVLPRRLPVATWERIRHYFKHPANLESPAPGESLSAEEVHQLRGTLSEEQMKLVRALLQVSQETTGEGGTEELPAAPKLPANPAEFVIAVNRDLNMTLEDALKSIGKKITELSLPDDYIKLRETHATS